MYTQYLCIHMYSICISPICKTVKEKAIFSFPDTQKSQTNFIIRTSLFSHYATNKGKKFHYLEMICWFNYVISYERITFHRNDKRVCLSNQVMHHLGK